MNEGMVLRYSGCGVLSAGEALALPGNLASSQTARKKISESAAAMLQAITDGLEQLICGAIAKRTADDFTSFRKEVYPIYRDAVLALPQLIRVVVPANTLDILIQQSFSEMEADFRDHELRYFGAAARDQALFTVWMQRKIVDLLNQVPAEKASVEQGTAAFDLLQKVVSYGVWTRFHLHCLATSMHSNRPIFPDTINLMVDGLRAGVNAYAHTRQLVDVLAPRQLPDEEPPVWDDEDEALLRESYAPVVIE